jgi:hypothetical protein
MTETIYQLIHQFPNGTSIPILETASKTEVFEKYDNLLDQEFKGSIKIIRKQIFSEKIAESYDERQAVFNF